MNLFGDDFLFNSPPFKKEVIELEDASLVLIENFFGAEEAGGLYKNLLNQVDWKSSQIELYGKVNDMPRLMAWHGDDGIRYTFSRVTLTALPFTSDLLLIKQAVEREAEAGFNSVLLNLYRNGKDSMGWHRDNEKELGENPVIASVSFGETRPFHLRHKFKKEVSRITIPLTHGSLLIMKGKTQHFWEHQIPKTAKMISARINLTFRQVHG